MDNQTPPPNPTPPTENIPVQNPIVAETPSPQVYTAPHLDNPPPPKKPFMFSKVLLPFLIIIILLLGVSGTYLALNFKPLPAGRQANPLTPTPTPVDETTNWKTYKGSDFEIKYLPDISVKTDEEGYIWFNKRGPTQRPQTEFYDALNLKIKTERLNGRSLESIAQAELSRSTSSGLGEIVKTLSKTSFNGKIAYTFTAKGLGIFKYTLVDYGTKYLTVIDFTTDPTNQGFEQTVEQILSTFKFLDNQESGASPSPTCTPRPACLDATPRCLIPETSDMCPKTVACTQDAKMCPDGSYVGREGPTCEFAACPSNP